MTEFYNVNVILEDQILKDGFVYINDTNGEIISVSDKKENLNVDKRIDGGGLYLSPGFVDIHVHGGGGCEFSHNQEQIKTACLSHLKNGTTGILPTTLASPVSHLKKIIRAVKDVQTQNVTNILGIHLEGPYLSPNQSGAQSIDNMFFPKSEEYKELFDIWKNGIKIMGAAPELPGGLELGKYLTSQSCVASIAHSDATFEQVERAIEYGYTDVTHIYSGCSTVHREKGYRIAGVVESGLYFDELTVQVIADGRHLPPALLKLIYKTKGADKIALITDALAPAGLPYIEGKEILQSNDVKAILEDQLMKLENREAFAGSIATMNKLVFNMVNLANVSLAQAVKMASYTPAKIIGLGHKKGKIQKGYDADLILFDEQINIKQVYLKGKRQKIDHQ